MLTYLCIAEQSLEVNGGTWSVGEALLLCVSRICSLLKVKQLRK